MGRASEEDESMRVPIELQDFFFGRGVWDHQGIIQQNLCLVDEHQDPFSTLLKRHELTPVFKRSSSLWSMVSKEDDDRSGHGQSCCRSKIGLQRLKNKLGTTSESDEETTWKDPGPWLTCSGAYYMASKFGRQLRLGWADGQLHHSRPISQAPGPVPTCVDDTDPHLLHQFQSAPLNVLMEPHEAQSCNEKRPVRGFPVASHQIQP
ncbi:hypothetical protein CFIO01_01002 [Colletotrichum fioriniae PJ7]|uniref:Uncharacterized protein n=1 Tax=Colletotrichum fioriniae PJ7 TaxID=1445577 RepID=A0A010QXM5_9PEZI|nr:hypothetical protein CFIO01_01002 [Colletotrichum fioriniae PJ7]